MFKASPMLFFTNSNPFLNNSSSVLSSSMSVTLLTSPAAPITSYSTFLFFVFKITPNCACLSSPIKRGNFFCNTRKVTQIFFPSNSNLTISYASDPLLYIC
eukprot:GHVP01002181.1.p1 GENE.GHVP01002181.1~~GHVP01002181.1.p1  ORF type:complete len:101 (+),score=2.97 GHVP01002181.1:70-372(+)